MDANPLPVMALIIGGIIFIGVVFYFAPVRIMIESWVTQVFVNPFTSGRHNIFGRNTHFYG